MGFSELMLTSWEDYDNEQLKNFINIIFDTSKNAYSLLENLLEWSRSQTGNIKITPDHISLFELVKENLSLMKGIAEKKNLNLVNKVDVSSTAYADSNMVKTVIRNLVSNAIKYTPNNGTITISSEQNGKSVKLSVSDTGVGIEKHNIDKLFKVDENFSTKGTNNEIGTGLGLVLCKEFIVKNSGNISVESSPDKGSNFIIMLPKEELS